MTHTLAVADSGFALGGARFDMWGIRVANALESDAAAHALVHTLDDYLAHGINTVAPFLQGGSTGSANPFDANGSFTRHTRREESSQTFKGRGDLEGVAVHNAHLDRLAVLIEEADARAMVVNVGVFYQVRIRQLTDEAAVIAAAQAVARWLSGKGYRNVFVDLVNEYGHPGFAEMPLCYGRSARYSADGGGELIRAFKRTAPHLPVSISDIAPRPICFPSADLVLMHSPFDPVAVRADQGREAPVVLNEWGFQEVGISSDPMNGLYTADDAHKWERTIETVRAGGGFVFYHSAWKQHLTEHGGPHFELGPEGAQPRDPHGSTPSDHWYFDLVQRLRAS